jgi:copper transport protein
MTRRLALVVLLAATGGVLWPTAAGAHATLQTTEPTADAVVPRGPDVVALEFTEAVDVGLGGVKVLSPGGARVDQGAPERSKSGTRLEVPVDASARGTYTVVWSVTSEDNHTISGTVLFSVGAVSGAATVDDASESVPRAAGGAGRWLAFAGTLIFVGALFFDRVAGRTAAAAIWRAACFGALAVIAGTLASVLSQTAISSGRSLADAVALFPDAVTDTRFGRLGLGRVLLGLAALGAAVVAPRRPSPTRILAGAVAVGLVSVPALGGHAWTTDPRWLAVAFDTLHVAATSAWIGGILHLARSRDVRQDRPTLLRFSRLAGWAVALVILTGLGSSYLQVRSLDALVGTGYGVLLLVKVALVVGLIFLGWLNRRTLASSEGPGGVHRVVLVELVLAVVVIALTAALVNRPPARTDVSRPFSEVIALSAGGSVQAEVQPARVGTNDIHLYFLDERGLPSPIDAVEVSVGRVGIPARRVTVTPVTADHASAYAVAFPAPGAWTIEVTAARDGSETTAEFEVRIR